MFSQYITGADHIEFPSFSVAVFTILLAFALSTVISLTYKFTFQKEHFPNKLFQALALSSTLAAMIMMVFSNNAVTGLMVLGAVLIIRFRELIHHPQNIIFIFAALSIGIATGKLNYVVAISGTTVFCYIMFLLYYTPYESDPNK